MAMPRVTSRRAQFGRRRSQKALHHDLAGQRRRHRRIEAGGQQRHREQRRGDAEPEQRRQQLEGLADLGDVGWPLSWKVAAATIRIAALTNSASISAMVSPSSPI